MDTFLWLLQEAYKLFLKDEISHYEILQRKHHMSLLQGAVKNTARDTGRDMGARHDLVVYCSICFRFLIHFVSNHIESRISLLLARVYPVNFTLI